MGGFRYETPFSANMKYVIMNYVFHNDVFHNDVFHMAGSKGEKPNTDHKATRN